MRGGLAARVVGSRWCGAVVVALLSYPVVLAWNNPVLLPALGGCALIGV